MYYYVWFDPENKPIGWLETDKIYKNAFAVEVSREEYIQYGGVVSGKFQETNSDSTEPKTLTDLKIQAITERQEFLEDCIAEMAQIVYQ